MDDFLKQYTDIQSGHLKRRDESSLVDAQAFGRNLVLSDVPPEDFGALHESALKEIAQDLGLPDISDFIEQTTAILLEVLLVYGLSYRDKVQRLEDAGAALKQGEKRFRDFTAASSDWHWEMGKDLTFTSISDRFESMTSVKVNDLIGKPITSLTPLISTSRQAACCSPSIQSRTSFRDCVFRLKSSEDENVYVVLNGVPVFDGVGDFSGYRGTGRNITPRIQAEIRAEQEEERRVQTEKELMQAQKLEALGQLAGGMAHEFNNMLVPMVGLVELVKDDLPEGSDQQKNLKMALDAALRARDLVGKILGFSRTDANAEGGVDLCLAITDAVKMLKSTLPTSIQINCVVPDEPVEILANATEIHQIIFNLGKNASDAIGLQAGTISISLARTEVSGMGNSDITSLTPGEYALLEVSDTGPGMEKDIQERIFDPFFTTKSVGQGTGMGLSVIYGIVQKRGGSVEVVSEPGRGTTFTIYLPLGNKAGLAPAQNPLVTPITPLNI